MVPRASASLIAMLAIARVAAADPAIPQLAPTRGDREDAHRLDVQRHELDRGTAHGAPAAVAPPHQETNVRRVVGLGILGFAAASLLTSAVLFADASNTMGSDASSTGGKVFLGIGVISGAVGAGLFLSSGNSSSTVIVAPAPTPGGAALVISGRL